MGGGCCGANAPECFKHTHVHALKTAAPHCSSHLFGKTKSTSTLLTHSKSKCIDDQTLNKGDIATQHYVKTQSEPDPEYFSVCWIVFLSALGLPLSVTVVGSDLIIVANAGMQHYTLRCQNVASGTTDFFLETTVTRVTCC